MEDSIFIIPAAISLIWGVRIFLLKDASNVQLLAVGGLLAAAVSFFVPQVAAFCFPFFYLAIRLKTTPRASLGKWDSLVFLPSVAVLPFGTGTVFSIFLGIQISAVFFLSIRDISRYSKRLADMYDEAEVSAEGIRQTLIFLILSAVACAIASLLPDGSKDAAGLQVILSTFISVLQFLVGLQVFRLKDDAPVADILIEDETARPSPNLAVGKAQQLVQRVEDEKLFLDPYLSLVSLAEKLHTNRTYLSASIHTCREKNFSDFINALRVQHFIQLVLSGKCTGIKEAALQSGYNNIQSFYRHFSEIMQMTPKAWISHVNGKQ